jgi:hypothetical protein
MTATKSALLKIEINLAKTISIGEKKFPKTMIKVAVNDWRLVKWKRSLVTRNSSKF